MKNYLLLFILACTLILACLDAFFGANISIPIKQNLVMLGLLILLEISDFKSGFVKKNKIAFLGLGLICLSFSATLFSFLHFIQEDRFKSVIAVGYLVLGIRIFLKIRSTEKETEIENNSVSI